MSDIIDKELLLGRFRKLQDKVEELNFLIEDLRKNEVNVNCNITLPGSKSRVNNLIKLEIVELSINKTIKNEERKT